MRADGLAALDNRSRDIFRRIVETYLDTGDPVGSRNVSRILQTALSPASVRNVMSDLEEMGLIYAPHTSAGRLPTELGLRFFIDTLSESSDSTECPLATALTSRSIFCRSSSESVPTSISVSMKKRRPSSVGNRPALVWGA